MLQCTIGACSMHEALRNWQGLAQGCVCRRCVATSGAGFVHKAAAGTVGTEAIHGIRAADLYSKSKQDVSHARPFRSILCCTKRCLHTWQHNKARSRHVAR